jgi:hypothetical protein
LHQSGDFEGSNGIVNYGITIPKIVEIKIKQTKNSNVFDDLIGY